MSASGRFCRLRNALRQTQPLELIVARFFCLSYSVAWNALFGLKKVVNLRRLLVVMYSYSEILCFRTMNYRRIGAWLCIFSVECK